MVPTLKTKITAAVLLTLFAVMMIGAGTGVINMSQINSIYLQGSGTKLLTSGTISGTTGSTLCTNSSGAATTSSCTGGGGGSGAISQITTATCTPSCTSGTGQILISGSSTTSVTWASIPGTGYNDLFIVYNGRLGGSTTTDGLYVYLNSDTTGSDYSYQCGTFHSSSTPTSSTGNGALYAMAIDAGNTNAGLVSEGTLWFTNYTNTTFAKVIHADPQTFTVTNFGSLYLAVCDGFWAKSPAAAITQIQLAVTDGTTPILAGSVFTLYGRN